MQSLLNKTGSLDANKVRSPKYASIVELVNKHIDLPISISEKVYLIKQGLTSIPTCYCGKETTWSVGRRGYGKYCSIKCASNDPTTLHVRKTKPSEESRQKRKNTNLERYGVESPFHSKDIQKKIRSKNMEKYGVDNPLKRPEVVQRVKETNLKKYGATTAIQSPKYLKKTAELKVKRLFEDLLSGKRTDGQSTPLFKLGDWSGVDTKYLWKCNVCQTNFSDSIEDGSFPRCPKCNPVTFPRFSLEEKEVADFIASMVEVKLNDHSVISPRELDIVVESHKIAIEYNGAYWHSEKAGKGKTYHLDKTLECERAGYRLVHIFDWEWKKNRGAVENYLKTLFGKKEVVYARECDVRPVSKNAEKDFLTFYHLQGYVPSKNCYGLYYNNHLIGLMSFTVPRFNHSHSHELLRLCFNPKYQITGGSAKLFSRFKEEQNPKSIISYSDRRFFTGQVYTSLGMKEMGSSSPSYWYTKNFVDVLSRYQCQKKQLHSLLKKFDESLSETENMQMNGYTRIWDCGTSVFSSIVSCND
jgi:hypothetical protein